MRCWRGWAPAASAWSTRGGSVQLDRPVAIKVLPQSAAASPEWRRRFEREARVLSALAHPNVVPFTDFGIDGDVPYLVMELLRGKTLAELISEGPVAPARALDIVRQTLRGLAAAHDQAIAHRDLKPANIFLQALPEHADHVRLLDFGMAKFLEGVSSPSMAENLSRVGVVFGTPAYMSPEQAKAERVDTRADIYAAGAILFQLLAGRPPYVADTPEGVMEAHVSEPVPSLAEAAARASDRPTRAAGDRTGDGQEAGGSIPEGAVDAVGAGSDRRRAARRGYGRGARADAEGSSTRRSARRDREPPTRKQLPRVPSARRARKWARTRGERRSRWSCSPPRSPPA